MIRDKHRTPHAQTWQMEPNNSRYSNGEKYSQTYKRMHSKWLELSITFRRPQKKHFYCLVVPVAACTYVLMYHTTTAGTPIVLQVTASDEKAPNITICI